MSKSKINKNIMSQIKSGQLKMKPRWYFVLGSILTLLGLLGITFAVIFLTNLTIFLLNRPGFVNSFRFDYLLNSFPLWVPTGAIIGMIIGLILLKRYDFSYRHNFRIILIFIIAAIISSSYLLNSLGLNQNLSTHTPLRELYKQLDPKSSSQQPTNPGRGSGSVRGAKHYGKLK